MRHGDGEPMTHEVTLILGDGVGPELAEAAARVLSVAEEREESAATGQEGVSEFASTGETAAAARLEAETDFVVNAHRHDRRGRIGRDDDLQSVRQSRVFHCNLQSIHPLPPVR